MVEFNSLHISLIYVCYNIIFSLVETRVEHEVDVAATGLSIMYAFGHLIITFSTNSNLVHFSLIRKRTQFSSILYTICPLILPLISLELQEKLAFGHRAPTWWRLPPPMEPR